MPTLPARAALAAGLVLTLGRAAGAGPDRPPPPPAPLPIATVVGTPARTQTAYQVVQVPAARVIVEVPPPNVVYRDAAPAPPCPPPAHGLFARFCPCRTHAARRATCPAPAGPRVACAPASPAPAAGDAALRQATAQLAAITQAVEANTRALTEHEQRLGALEGWARSYDPTGKAFPRPFPAPAGQPAPPPIPLAPTNIRR